jgi:acetyltransferase
MEPLAPKHRYPFDLVDVWHARDGERVLIRPVHPQDLELAREFVRELSPESRYNRFHQPLNDLTPQMAKWATHVDYQRHMALIAVVYRNGREVEIGAARYVVRGEDAETAEFAIAIADRWHRRGVAERLLRGLIAVAARRGIRWLEGDVLASNRGMLELARKLGFQSRKPRSDARFVTVSRRVTAQDADAASRVPARGGWLGLLKSFAPMVLGAT